MIATILFTDENFRTAGIVIVDLEDGSILRHADEEERLYERAFLLHPTGFDQSPFWKCTKETRVPVQEAIEALLLKGVSS